MKQLWKEALLAWGTVNLLFLNRWSAILPGVQDYSLAAPRPALVYVSLMGLVLFVAGIAFAIVLLVRRYGNPNMIRALRVIYVLGALWGLYALFYEGMGYLGHPQIPGWSLIVTGPVLIGGIAFLQWRHKGWHERIVPLAVGAMLLLAPLAPLMFAQGIYHSFAPGADGPQWEDVPGADASGTIGDHRVVLLLMDELDQRLVFEKRPEGLELPEFDRLRDEGLYASQAFAPSDWTVSSVPMQITSRLAHGAHINGPDSLQVNWKDEDGRSEWSDADTLFHWAHGEGKDIGVVGTYHPYCRLFAEFLTECTFVQHDGPHMQRLMPNLAKHLEGLVYVLPAPVPFRLDAFTWAGANTQLHQVYQYDAIKGHQATLSAAEQLVMRADLDLVYIHTYAPHPAGVYRAGYGYFDPEANDFTLGPDTDYIDNLVLADRTLGHLRQTMEEAGTWDETTFIISSDHGYRSSIWSDPTKDDGRDGLLSEPTDHRIVFLAKPPGSQTETRHYEAEFNAYILGDFVRHALSGGFADSAQMADWLDGHTQGHERPTYRTP